MQAEGPPAAANKNGNKTNLEMANITRGCRDAGNEIMTREYKPSRSLGTNLQRGEYSH